MTYLKPQDLIAFKPLPRERVRAIERERQRGRVKDRVVPSQISQSSDNEPDYSPQALKSDWRLRPSYLVHPLSFAYTHSYKHLYKDVIISVYTQKREREREREIVREKAILSHASHRQ